MAEDNLEEQLRVMAAAYRPGISEFAAASYRFERDREGFVRIALGNIGPVVDGHGRREPVYHHAVTMSGHMAIDLARQILANYAAPGVAAGLGPS